MLLPFEEFQGKGVLDFSSPSSSCSDSSLLAPGKWNSKQGSEPTSVLDIGKSPSPPNSSSTLSSSHGGATTAVSSNFVGIGNEKCGMGMGIEDWESLFSGSQENSILRLIMGEVEDPAANLSKISPSGHELEFNAGFGMVDQGGGFPFEFSSGGNFISGTEPCPNFAPISNPVFSSSPCNNPQFQEQLQPLEAFDEKPQIFNLINQNQTQFPQNPAMFLQFPFTQLQEHNLLSPPPPAKRLNSGSGPPKNPFLASGQELYLRRQQKLVTDEFASKQLQEAIMDDIFKATELIETRNPALAQGILARLNHQLSPLGKPLQRAAFFFKEALQLLLQNGSLSPSNLVCKIGAYKSFSEISPMVQFANFTCNQAILEACVGFDKIHIVDFDIGYGAQWASLMQELVLRRNAAALKITAFCSSSTHDELELGFTLENLRIFANEINLPFEIDVVKVESLNPGSWQFPLQGSEREGIAVNLPVSAFSNHPSTFQSILLRFVKQMYPKIVVSLDRGCDRTDVPFAHHVIHALQSYTGLLESLDAANASIDALPKIEKFLLQPSIEKIILGRHKSLERTPTWRSLFLQAGFSPLAFSNFNESQAECLVQRTPVKGFHVEKRQYSLVLYWQRRELVAASAWRC